MDHLLRGSGLTLTYLRDRRAIEGIDWPLLFDDLLEPGGPPNRCLWGGLDNLSHVVLATDRTSGRTMGLVGLMTRQTAHTSYLVVEQALVHTTPAEADGANGAYDATLLGAMLAHMLARIVTLEGRPACLAAAHAIPGVEAALRGMLATPGMAAHPPEQDNVINFQAASLACRIGRPALLLDLRAVTDTDLMRALRRMHCLRGPRRGGAPDKKSMDRKKAGAFAMDGENNKAAGESRAGGPAKQSPARAEKRRKAVIPASPADATPRPRKATRTGRIG